MLTYFWSVFLQMLAQCFLSIVLAVIGTASYFLGHKTWKVCRERYIQGKTKRQGYVNV